MHSADLFFGKKNKKKAIFIRRIISSWASALTKQSKIGFFSAKLVIGFLKFRYALLPRGRLVFWKKIRKKQFLFA